jgi:hypothetical protein
MEAMKQIWTIPLLLRQISQQGGQPMNKDERLADDRHCPSLTSFTFGLSHKTVLRWLFCSGLGVIEIIVSAHTSFIIFTRSPIRHSLGQCTFCQAGDCHYLDIHAISRR